mgnify:CR=1 FL=1
MALRSNFNNRPAHSLIQPLEGEANGISTLSFEPETNEITFINDSPTLPLLIRTTIDEGDWATLMPSETVTIQLAVRTMQIKGQAVPYRIWGLS